MTTDPFSSVSDSIIAPARLAYAVVPDATSDLVTVTRAIYVGSGGDVTLRAVGSTEDVLFRNLASGTVIAIRAKAVRATGTDAADLVGLA